MTEISDKKSDKCLFLLAEKGKWNIKDHLKPLSPIYNGTGWFIEEKHRVTAEQISQQANMKLLEWTLSGETFEEFRYRNKRTYINEKTAKIRLQIDNLKTALNIRELDNEKLTKDDMKSLLEQSSEGRQLIEYLREYSHLQEQIKHAEKEEKISKIKLNSESAFKYMLNGNSKDHVVEELKRTSPGVSTGFIIGDERVKIPGGALSVIAMPTSHGKTATLINFSLGVLNHHHDKSIYFFTYEESGASILTLFLNTYINKDLSKNNRESIKSYFTDGSTQYITEDKRQDFLRDEKAFFNHLIDKKRLNVFYSEMSVEELVAAIHFLKKHTPNIGLVCIDYMQLLRLLNSHKGSRQEELKQICHMLKDCAIETGLPILLGAQFNRTVVSEADLSPINIGEAGDIERIGNLIIGGWNRNFNGFSREGNKGKDGKSIPKEPTVYFEIMKGRGIGNGHNSVMSFNGNTGKLSNQIEKKYRM